jgi:hypothetical protein
MSSDVTATGAVPERKRIYHGDSKTRLYGVWKAMRARVISSSPRARLVYRDRGIGVAEAWQDWQSFKVWALANGYRDDLSLDRIDNYEGYHPGNCRWATKAMQVANRRPVAEWALPHRKIQHAEYPAIWLKRKAKRTLASIAADYDCSQATIHRIIRLDPARSSFDGRRVRRRMI